MSQLISFIGSAGETDPSYGFVAPVEELTIEEFLANEQSKDLLRFSTAGSVDDGKSTLIGRLLYDSQNVYEDHVRAVTRVQGTNTAATIDFAQLTDGLRAEREQGITIDVAYRYFSTSRRKFIIADTPGHVQYTRNMATGASTADLAIILVDARKGILTQSRRHAYIASLLGIPRLVAAVNKMDLVNFSQAVFEQHQRDLQALAASLGDVEILCIPVSALEGDNVVTRSENTPWYTGPSLLEHLETVPVAERYSTLSFRMPVQRVIRPDQQFRGFAGQISAGTVRPGDRVVSLPSGRTSKVKTISTFDGNLSEASAPLSITVTLEDELDISRGDVIAQAASAPRVTKNLRASLVWLHPDALKAGKTYLLKHTTQTVKARVSLIEHKIDIETLAQLPATHLEMNEIGVVLIESTRALIFDPYQQNRSTGSFILIDPASHATVGAGMIASAVESSRSTATGNLKSAAVISVGNRSGLADLLEAELLAREVPVVRTRVQDSATWRALLAAGVLTIVESEDSSTISVALFNEAHSELVHEPLLKRPEEADGSQNEIASQIIKSLSQRQLISKTDEEDEQ
jgi:sulfate adenylyltransferase large subunit